jgi:hypothetical protein
MWIFRSTHKHIAQDALSEYLDGRLQGKALERVELQLADCDACRQELAGLQAVVAVMQQQPMETPRRSFIMDAPPLMVRQSSPGFALRAPNWVYAGAASVAALAFAVTISMDATGGLTSDPLRHDAATVATAPTSESAQASGATGALSETGPMEAAAAEAEVTARFGTGGGLESTSAAGESTADAGVTTSATRESETESAPLTLAAAAPVAPTEDQAVQTQAGGGISDPAAEEAPLAPPAPEIALASEATSAPIVAAAPAPQGGEDSVAKSTDTESKSPVATPGDGSDKGSPGSGGVRTPPIFEPATPELYDDVVISGTSVWWRVLEVAAGILAALSLAALAIRWRTGRQH